MIAFLSPRVDAASDAVVFGVVPSATIQYDLLQAGQPDLIYRAGAQHLWLITRADQSPQSVLTSNKLQAGDFGLPTLVYEKGMAQVYELTPLTGQTPRQSKKPRINRPD